MAFPHKIGNTTLEMALSHFHKNRNIFLLLLFQQTLIPSEPIANSHKALAAGKPLYHPFLAMRGSVECLQCGAWHSHGPAGPGREERALQAGSREAAALQHLVSAPEP